MRIRNTGGLSSRLLPWVAACLALGGWLNAAAGQEFSAPPSAAGGPQLLAPGYSMPVPAAPPRTSLLPARSPIKYWIVSTRACPHGGLPADVNSGAEFIYREQGAGLKLGSSPEFLGSLIPGAPVCFVVHGSFISWDTVLADSEATNAWIRAAAPGQPLNVVFFTWPSNSDLTYITPVDIAILIQRAGYQSLYLGQLIAQLPPEQPVSLVGHSLGARTVASTLQLLATGQSEGYQLPQLAGQQRRVRAVFAAGAVDHHLLNPGERYGNALSATEGLLNLRNSDDLVLTLYPLHRPFTVPPLGRIGLTSTDRWQLGEWNSKITELELSPMLGRRHLWEHFYHQPRLAAAMAPYVYFADSPLQFSTGGPSTYQRQAGPQTAPAQGRDVLRQVGAEAPEKHGVLPGLNLNSRLLPRR